MRKYLLSHRLLILFLLCGLLLAIPLGALYFKVNVSHAAYTIHNASVHPHYHYAGQFPDKQFKCQAVTTAQPCYGPAQITNAYNIQPLLHAGINGSGSTIVILDAFQAPQLPQDLKRFDTAFGLNDPVLNIITPGGPTPFEANSAEQVGWSGEISLDVEWAHAIAPAATIDLVLASSSQDTALIAALNYALDKNLGDVISMSFGENETCAEPTTVQAWHDSFFKATSKGVTLLAASSDSGAAQSSCNNRTAVRATSLPAVDPLVTAVGGTQLKANVTTGSYQGEVAWNEPFIESASGGGFSTIYHKPFYQYAMPGIGSFRALPDVAYNASVNNGVLTAWSEGPRGPAAFYTFGGTSAGSPQWAGIIALGVQLAHTRLGLINPTLYHIGHSPDYTSAFHDITAGTNTITLPDSNGEPITIQGYKASPAWDLTTGWGSPSVAHLLPLLIALIHSNNNQQQTQLSMLH